MNILDLFIILILLVCMLQSYRSGFMDELLTCIFFCLSLYFAYICAPVLIPFLHFISEKYTVMKISSIIFLFISFYLITKIFKEFILDILNETELNGFDHFAGMLLGLVKAAVFISIIIILFSLIRLESVHSLVQDSFISGKVLAVVGKYKSIFFI